MNPNVYPIANATITNTPSNMLIGYIINKILGNILKLELQLLNIMRFHCIKILMFQSKNILSLFKSDDGKFTPIMGSNGPGGI